jgi:ABC-type phosphate transport system permease subunit
VIQALPTPQSPIIVRIIEPPRDPTGLADVLVGSLGLTGVIVLLAVALGLVMAGLLVLIRSRNPLDHS